MKACPLPPLWNLASLFPLWRELLAPINEFVIGESPYSKEALDFLLNLYGAKVLGWKELSPSADGSVLLIDIERELMERQPYLTRRIDSLKGLVVKAKATPRNGRGGNVKSVVITQAGVRVIQPIWDRYRELSECLLEGVSISDRMAHYRVNRAIREKMTGIRLPPCEDSSQIHVVYTVMGVFEVERDLRTNWLPSLTGGTLGGWEAELLLTEYSILKAICPGTVPQPGRFIACEGPLNLLVARDLPALRRAHLIELSSARKRQGKLSAFRLSQAGIRAADALWQKLEKKAESWLAGVSTAERKMHLEVNGRIQSRLRPAWKRLLSAPGRRRGTAAELRVAKTSS